MALFTEEEKTLRRIEKRFAKGVVEYGLIEEGDKILIGLSGGKDSLALVELLARRSRILKPRFSVVAAHVVMRNIPYQSDTDYLRSYVSRRECLSCCTKRSSMRVRIPASLLVSCVRGTGARLCSLWQRNRGVTK